ncbi:MAG: MFS transporter [Geminicoccaceae bacterium]
MAFSGGLAFALWTALINNFAYQEAGFNGADIGLLQSVREIPGFLSIAVVFLLFLLAEQRLALVSLILLAGGTAITGLYPSMAGLLITTTIMSIGFHYYETVAQSLSLQWLSLERAPGALGVLIAVRSAATLLALGGCWIAFELIEATFASVYLVGGGLALAIAFAAWLLFPAFPALTIQRRHIVLRRRYWLYYALVFLSGARRQIFVVFAGFLLVEKFGYSVANMTLLLFLNSALNLALAPLIGRMIGRIGERRALIIEYVGLIIVFAGYGLVQSGTVAAVLYIADHVFFAMAIAIKTYFQKIGDPADMAPTAAVSFTINHIAAVFIPVLFGLIWLVSPAAVFFAGAGLAACSLVLATMVPNLPKPGLETIGRPAIASNV